MQEEKAAKTTPADNILQRMVDREAKRAEGKGVGYDRWAAKHNLKQMAATVTAYQQYGFSSPEELDEACSVAYTAMQESLAELKQVEKTLNGKKELQRQVLAYSKTRPVRDLSLIHISGGCRLGLGVRGNVPCRTVPPVPAPEMCIRDRTNVGQMSAFCPGR